MMDILKEAPAVIHPGVLGSQYNIGEPVYLEMRTASWPEEAYYTGWALISDIRPVYTGCCEIGDWVYVFTGIKLGRAIQTIAMPLDTYGVEWRCWFAEPAEEAREGTKWEG